MEDARSWLTDLPGVGPKTAAIVLLFALGRPAFPVDTHVHRVTRRLGLIPSNASREKAHVLLEEMLPADVYYSFHINLIEHGRKLYEHHLRGQEFVFKTPLAEVKVKAADMMMKNVGSEKWTVQLSNGDELPCGPGMAFRLNGVAVVKFGATRSARVHKV